MTARRRIQAVQCSGVGILIAVSIFHHRNVGYKPAYPHFLKLCAYEEKCLPPSLYLRCNLKEFSTTEIELKAIAPDAIIGLSLPIAATGMATVL